MFGSEIVELLVALTSSKFIKIRYRYYGVIEKNV